MLCIKSPHILPGFQQELSSLGTTNANHQVGKNEKKQVGKLDIAPFFTPLPDIAGQPPLLHRQQETPMAFYPFRPFGGYKRGGHVL